jgi:ethanolamine utilization protein EutA (predicted chaperonin)
MKKLMLDVERLAVETFEVVESPETLRGTVQGAESATLLLSGCLSGCMPSGIKNCLSPQTC